MARFGRSFPIHPIIVKGIVTAAALSVTASDTAHATDSVGRSLSLVTRTVSDSAPASDSVGRSISLATRTVSDSAPATDSAVGKPTRTVSDSAPASDSVGRTLSLATRTVSDSAPASDKVTTLVPRPVSDSAPATDAVARTISLATRSISDNAAATDAVARTISLVTRTTSDSAPASDTTSRGLTESRPIADSAPATDAVTRAAQTFTRSASDRAAATDTVSGIVVGAGAPAVLANKNWPLLAVEIDFSNGAGPPAAPPSTFRQSMNASYRRLYTRKIDIARGRQYELDQVQAGQATLEIPDPNELLNPDNPTSPFNTGGNTITAYRPMWVWCMWPNQPGSGNLYNPNVRSGADPSFESGTFGFGAFDGTATVATSTAQHFDGLQSLLTTQTAPGWGKGCAMNLANRTAPGITYTVSAYVFPTGGASVQIAVVDALGNIHTGTTATAQNTWTRIYVSWTCVDTLESVVLTGTVSATPTFYTDAIQLEFGSTLSAYTTTGPTLYPLFTGYCERFPTKYDMGGLRAVRPLVAVDALAILSRTAVSQSYAAEIAQDTPTIYIPYNEQGAPNLVQGQISAQGTQIVPAGGSVNFAGDTFLDGSPAMVISQQVQDATQTPFANQITSIDIPHNNAYSMYTGGMTFEFWARWSAGSCHFALFQANSSGNYTSWSASSDHHLDVAFGAITTSAGLFLGSSDQQPFPGFVISGRPASTSGSFTADGTNGPDGKWHYYSLTLIPTGNQYEMRFTVDGAFLQVTPQTSGTTSIRYLGGNGITSVASTQFGDNQSTASIANVAAYFGDIGTSRQNIHYQRGAGYVGETSTARVLRLLGQYWGSTASVYNGALAMASDHGYNTRTLLDVLQEIQESERGLVYAAATGFVIFESRLTRHYNEPTGRWVFGENPAGASPVEYPYTDYEVDNDPTYTFSQANLTRPGNDKFPPRVNTTTQGKYGQRILTQQVQCLTDFDLTQAGIFYLNRYSTTKTRISSLVLKPSANPALWPAVLSLEISQRITVTRRVGSLTVKNDYYVEQIAHRIDADTWEWKTTLQLSPVFVPATWLLGDATRGVLGSTTVPVY